MIAFMFPAMFQIIPNTVLQGSFKSKILAACSWITLPATGL
ncbi:hypothetical protein GcM3_193038 [Golovinomyces cichoracearum]|uniref:Uncharacterized protein n=1 Tax=Golovinomyces cichoracearum TaxID=62708 RepID=A0A420HH19_9PEZI|nr:hypothetical protein GcM3_193038 [Golovinomyces cichoracearum]